MGAKRPMLSAWKDQYAQPERASIEYTARLSLPMKTRPSATVGCDELTPPPGKPNAHFSVSFGTSRAVRPAAAAAWNRALFVPPHPFHAAVVERSPSGGLEVQRFAIFAVPVPSTSKKGRRATNSVRSRFCLSGMAAACGAIDPLVIA